MTRNLISIFKSASNLTTSLILKKRATDFAKFKSKYTAKIPENGVICVRENFQDLVLNLSKLKNLV